MRNQRQSPRLSQVRTGPISINLFHLVVLSILILMDLSSRSTFCSAEDAICNATFTNTDEYTSTVIGYCVQTCPDVASAEGYKCQVVNKPDPKTNATVQDFVCPCKEQVGDVQLHINDKNLTYFTGSICHSRDVDDFCVDACAKYALGPEYSTPFKCKSSLFRNDAAGQLASDGTPLQTFCACGMPNPAPPKTIMPNPAPASAGGDETAGDKTKREAGNSKGKGKGKGKNGRGKFPKILSQLFNALKYVKNFFRKMTGQSNP